ncbi:MAG TPA: hypothetical protein VG389_04770 [Myxococcota bacterium]|nr:hypothetical protein [Myxococcota bacterium]
MNLSATAPLLFGAQDFDAYAETRQSSNLFNRRRQEVNQKLDELARRVAGLPVGAELERCGLTRGLSDPHPSLRNQHLVTAQWLFFVRDDAERALLSPHLERTPATTLVGDVAPHHQNLALTVRVDASGLCATLELHPPASVDRRNWIAAASTPEGEAALGALLAPLAGAGFSLRGAGPVVGRSSRAGTGLSLVTLLEALRAERPAPVQIEALLPGDVDPTQPAAAALAALCPLYRLAAWSDQNDRLGLRATIAQAREAALAKAQREREEEQERQRQRREQQQSAREKALREGPRSVLPSRPAPRPSGDERRDGAAGDTPREGPRRAPAAAPAAAASAAAQSQVAPEEARPGPDDGGGHRAQTPHANGTSRAPSRNDRPTRRDRDPRPAPDRRTQARGPDHRSDGPDHRSGVPTHRSGGPAHRPGGPDRRSGDSDRRPGRAAGPDGQARIDGAQRARAANGPGGSDHGGRDHTDRPRSGRDERPRPAPRPRRVLPDASAPQLPVAVGDEVVIVNGLFNGKVAVVLATGDDGAVELGVGHLRMTLAPDAVRKI